jgi:alkanesulfonate monooxygenase SsuD/methylene tetrahydromethanopterin reductase-like flavin-dependent oxidoreductase (luciferase family)
MNGHTLEGFQTQFKDVKEQAEKAGRAGQVKFALNGFVIMRETEVEATQVVAEIQGKAIKEAVEAFGDLDKNAGPAVLRRAAYGLIQSLRTSSSTTAASRRSSSARRRRLPVGSCC